LNLSIRAGLTDILGAVDDDGDGNEDDDGGWEGSEICASFGDCICDNCSDNEEDNCLQHVCCFDKIFLAIHLIIFSNSIS
jgi:hypothetical protein